MSLQILREERARIAAQMQEIANKAAKDWDAGTDPAAYDKAVNDLDAVDMRIKAQIKSDEILAENGAGIAERADQLAHDKGKPALSQFARWLRQGDSAISAAEWTTIRNTMSTTTTTEGGYTVQTSVAQTVIDLLRAYGGMRQAANVIMTGMGNTIQFPTSDGTSETGEIIGQNTTATSADVVFGAVTVPVYKFSSKIVAIPLELLQDSMVDVESFVNKRLATRIGRIQNTKFTLGSGVSEPNGLLTAASVGVTLPVGNTLTFTYDGIMDLIHSVDPAYRAMSPKFMMSDQGLKAVRKIKDAQSRPLFVPGYDATAGGAPNSAPDTIAGYGVVINQDFAVPGVSAKSMAFGAFGEYLIRDVMEFTLFRFTDSAYTKLGQVGFLAWARSGSNLLDTTAVKLLVNSAT